MFCLLSVVLQSIVIITGIRQEERAGLWIWSKFFFALGFAALEVVILVLPYSLIHDTHNPYFWPVYAGSWIVAALNFIWLILVARRWRLPDGRTNLQASCDEQTRRKFAP